MARTIPAAAAPAATPFNMRAILAPLVAIIVGIFMVVLDTTAVNVAVPGLVRQFHGTIPTLQWTITGYALAQAAVIPLAGWLSDRFGAKGLFLTSLVLFTLGSALCATAQSSGMLIAFRVLQGLGGGFVLPVAMAYIYRLSPPEKVGAVMGLMGIPILLAPAIGPVLAGWLVQYASWRWIFLLNLPVGVIGVTLGLRSLPVTARQVTGGLDLPGMILGPLAFVALSYGITEGSGGWTSDKALGGIVVGAIALVLFVRAELRAEAPLLELRVIKAIDFSLAMVAQWVGQFALFGALFLVPLFVQQVRGYGAFDTGLILLPQAIAAAVFMPIGGVLFDRIGARPLVMGGSALLAGAAFMLTSMSSTTKGTDLILPLALYGAGMGLMMMPINTHLINAAPRRLVSRVTSLIGALQQVITSLTIVGMSTILTSRPSYHEATAGIAALATHVARAGHGSTGAAQLPPAISMLFSHSFDDTFVVIAVMAIVGAAMGLVLRRHPAAQEAEAAAVAEAEDAPELEWALLAG
jgi:EmrB/QacA subfamily drug resistance transporter